MMMSLSGRVPTALAVAVAVATAAFGIGAVGCGTSSGGGGGGTGLRSAVYSDSNANGFVDAGDEILVTFSG